jgi:hypothetical protein
MNQQGNDTDELNNIVATSHQVACSIPDEVIGLFRVRNPSSRCGPGIDYTYN